MIVPLPPPSYHAAERDVARRDALEMTSLKMPLSPRARRPFKRAWTTALLGFVLLILSFVLNVYFWMRWTRIVYGDYSFDDLRGLTWLNGVMGIARMIGIVLMVASIVFVIRGLLLVDDKPRAGIILIGTLKRLEWLALIALVFYLLYVPMMILIASVLDSAYMLISSSNPAFLFLATLPLTIAHALYKSST